MLQDNPRFKSDPNVEQIANDIYVYRNFLSDEFANYYTAKLDAHEEAEWSTHGNYEPNDHSNPFWNDKLSLDILEHFFHDQIFNYFAPDYWLYEHDNFVRLKTGQSSEIDNNDTSHMLGIRFPEYKVALYLGEFTGGEIVFPELDFQYKPEPKDLLIFSTSREHAHRTNEVLSGVRYAYTDFLVYHPGYFMP